MTEPFIVTAEKRNEDGELVAEAYCGECGWRLEDPDRTKVDAEAEAHYEAHKRSSTNG